MVTIGRSSGDGKDFTIVTGQLVVARVSPGFLEKPLKIRGRSMGVGQRCRGARGGERTVGGHQVSLAILSRSGEERQRRGALAE